MQLECGNIVIVSSGKLLNGHTKSCGCYRRDLPVLNKTKHGDDKRDTVMRLYKIWSGIKSRCYYVKNIRYKIYGGRGIILCESWHDYPKFKKWAVNNGYDVTKQIDRIDPNGNYEPSNCRWVNLQEQANNKRTTILITVDGITKPLSDWAREYGIKRATLYRRYMIAGKTGTELFV